MTFSDIADVHTLEELCKSIQDGDWIETKDQSSAGYRLLQIGNIAVGKFRESGKPRYVSEDTFRRLNCTKIEIGDVLIARMPEPTGRAWCVDAPIPDSITSVDVAIVRVDPTKLDAKYLAYFLNQKSTLQLIASLQTGSTRQRIKRSDLATLEIRTHSLDTQQAIANFLTNLDEKIASNSALSETLEDIAQTIFKSWFIDFDPVKAKMVGEKPAGMDAATAALFPDSMEESELGLIPKGWEISLVGNALDVGGGTTPSTTNSTYWDGEHCWTTPKDLSSQLGIITTSSKRRITDLGLAQISSGLLPVNSVLMSCRAPIGYVSINTIPTAVNQGFITMKHSGDFHPLYVLNWINANMHEIHNRAGGATFAEITRKAFKEIPFLKPANNVMRKYGEIAEPLLREIEQLTLQTKNLQVVRDLLLPRLISGELQIPKEMLAS